MTGGRPAPRSGMVVLSGLTSESGPGRGRFECEDGVAAVASGSISLFRFRCRAAEREASWSNDVDDSETGRSPLRSIAGTRC